MYNAIAALQTNYKFLNIFQYITFRSALAVILGMAISLFFMPMMIRWLQAKQLGQIIREDGPATHLKKKGTPTFGGVLIVLGTLIPTLLLADLTNAYIWMVLIVMLGYALVGFLDDYLKFTKKNPKGLWPRYKMTGQILFALIPMIWLYGFHQESTLLLFPFFKNLMFDLGLFYIAFATFVIVGSSNAVNFTDGLDGLAIGTTIIVVLSFVIYTYLTGNKTIADYLYYPYIRGTGELTIFCGALLGSSIGFLWYNAHPAEVFMGDVGALAIGGAVGSVAVFIKHEILLAFIGGIWVIEILSVVTQVASFKMRGKRIFKMAPIHHHFELKGWNESKVIVRFWIITALLCLVGLLSIKIR